MKRLLVVAVAVLSCAGMAFAQAGSVMISRPWLTADCNVTDSGALVVVYIFHEHAPAVTSSRFKVDVGTTGWTHLYDAWSTQDFVGTSVDGVTIEYGSCRTSSIYLGQIHFQGAAALACSHVGIVPDPGAVSGKIEAVDCNDNPMYPTGGQAIVNPSPDCQCTVPVEETTWGEIKALYR